MKFWLSEEVMADVADDYADVRREVATYLNQIFSEREYGSGLRQFDFIGMVLSDEGPGYKEVKRYSRKERSVEFRLRIDHSLFKRADLATRHSLIAESLARAIALLRTLGIQDLDVDRLDTDFRVAMKERGWFSA